MSDMAGEYNGARLGTGRWPGCARGAGGPTRLSKTVPRSHRAWILIISRSQYCGVGAAYAVRCSRRPGRNRWMPDGADGAEGRKRRVASGSEENACVVSLLRGRGVPRSAEAT